MELARGSIADRPWGRTLAALGLRGVSGQLALTSDGKRFVIALEHGAVVAAFSPLTSDAAVRVALTGHLVSSSQVPEISRRQALAPERDEIDVIAELARLGPDHALRLRRRVIAQRAARTFSLAHGEFVVSDRSELAVLDGCALDIRAVIYMGARANLPEGRLAAELDQLGSWFRLKPGVADDLPQFGFGDAEQPVLDRLRDGGSIEQLESFATTFVEARTVRSVVYALASYNACEAGPPRPRRVEEEAIAMTRELPRVDANVGTAQTQPITTMPLPTLATTTQAGRATPAPSPTPPRGRAATQPGTRSNSDMSELTPISIARLRPMSEATPTSLRTSRPTPTPATLPRASTRTPTEGTPIAIQRPRPASAPGELTPISVPRPPERGPAARTPGMKSSGAIRLPDLDDDLAVPATTRPAVQGPAARSSPNIAIPTVAATEASAGHESMIVRVASARPANRLRRVSTADTPQSHEVKVLIAQRLKLLDGGADHYQLLGVSPDAHSEQIRRAYFGLARQLHPDRLAALGIPDDGRHAQRLFAQINAGFAVLSDAGRRADYTNILRRGGEAAIRAEEAQAEQLARRILEAEEAFHRGEIALRRDQPHVAVGELSRAVQLNPDEADYHALLAWAQFCASPDRLAIAPATRSQLDHAIQRSPHAVTARFYLGRVERMLGRDADAARLFREVLAAAPGHTDAAAELRVLEARLDKPSGGGLFGRKR
jgi:hypothetical protein